MRFDAMKLQRVATDRVATGRLAAATLLAALLCLTTALPAAAAGSYDTNPAWPLCGRITENPPSGWTEAQGCSRRGPKVSANHLTTGTTPETTPYDVTPPWFDMQTWNRQYTYKDSSSIPYSDFENGGPYESPYAGDSGFPTSYDAGYHMDNATSTDSSIGEFNGALIAPENLTSSSTDYIVAFAFTELSGPSAAADLCVEATATDVLGSSATAWAGNCP